jgi:hypothetical protein
MKRQVPLKSEITRIFHELLAATTDMAVLPGVLGCSFDRLRTGSPCDVPFRYASAPIPRYRGTVSRWHAHLCGLATAIHEISGLKLSSVITKMQEWCQEISGLATVRIDARPRAIIWLGEQYEKVEKRNPHRLARMFHESPAATTDMVVLPGVLGCRYLRRTIQVRLETNPAVPRDGCQVARPSSRPRDGNS